MVSIGGLNWQARSPDFNPLDIFAWGSFEVFMSMSATMPQNSNRLDISTGLAWTPRPGARVSSTHIGESIILRENYVNNHLKFVILT